jgi:hypothetical protein
LQTGTTKDSDQSTFFSFSSCSYSNSWLLEFDLKVLSVRLYAMSGNADANPSLIEYARFHGLAVDHTSHENASLLEHSSLREMRRAKMPEFKISDTGHLPPEPKFRLNRTAVSLLSSALQPPPMPDWSSMLSDHQRAKKLKLERPALRTDHDTDMKKFRCRRLPSMESLHLPFFVAGQRRGQRFDWPASIRNNARKWNEKITEEKLQTTWEVLKFLQDTIRPIHDPQRLESLYRDDLASTTVRSTLPAGKQPEISQLHSDHGCNPCL